MPVSVSLRELVRVLGTRRLWPEEFSQLVAAVEDEPADRNRWRVASDWCRDHDEPDMADAFAWVAKRPSVEAVNRPMYGKVPCWHLNGLPQAVLTGPDPDGACDTLAGRVSVLSFQLDRLREHLS